MKYDEDETPETEPADGWGDSGDVHSDDWGDTESDDGNTEGD